jgi:hypothetical protein
MFGGIHYRQVQPNSLLLQVRFHEIYTMILSRCYLFRLFLLNDVVSGVYHNNRNF